jgi:hypothetical protein
MSSIKLKGSSSGDVTITVPAAAGTNTVTIPAVTGTLPLSNLSHVTNRPNTKPLVINGDMQVAQRGTSLTGQTGTAFQMDRFGFQMDTFGTWTMTQADDGPTGSGFTHSLKWDCTTADTSLGAGHFGLCHYRMEGQDLQLLKKGTSSAEKVTISFWVKSAKTGTYILELYDVDNSRHISQAYTISSADTWEQKVLVFAGDTTGALGNDNGNSLAISWWLGAGSNYNSATLQTSWGANDTDARATGVVNLADSTSNDWYLTGVQIEVGEYTADTIPPFQHESYIENVERCWRYFEACTGDGGTGIIGQGFLSDGSGRVATLIGFHPKRATPTVTTSAAGTFTGSQGVQAGGVATGFILAAWSNSSGANSGVDAGLGHVHLDTSGHSSMTDGQICRVANTNGTTAFIKCDSEL